jgi:hypothetical protein
MNEKAVLPVSTILSHILLLTHYHALLYEKAFGEKQGEIKQQQVRCLQQVTGPRRRRCRGHRGGRRHRREVVAPADPPSPPPSVVPHRRVLEWPPSPSPDRPVNRSLLSDPDTHPRGHQGRPCTVHGWDCPNWIALVHDPSSLRHQGEEEGGEDEDDECQILVVVGPVGAPMISRTACISIGPRGRPQRPLAPRTTTMPPTSPTPSLATLGPPHALPSSKDGPSGSGTPPDLRSLCGNRLLRQFTHLAAPSGKGRAPGSWDSTVVPSR